MARHHTADTTQVRKASADDVPRIADTLARAFFDDPVFRWVCPDDERREALLPGFFALFTEAMAAPRRDLCGGRGRGRRAVGAARKGRGATKRTPRSSVAAWRRCAAEEAERLFGISKLLDEHHPPGSYYFLQFIGVEPQSQGRGIGSALLAHMLECCDREGAPAYLDATSPTTSGSTSATASARAASTPRGRAAALAHVARTQPLNPSHPGTPRKTRSRISPAAAVLTFQGRREARAPRLPGRLRARRLAAGERSRQKRTKKEPR